MSIHYLSTLFGILAVLSTSAIAADIERLSFEKKVVEITLEPGEQIAKITFPFTNKSGSTVEIEGLSKACSCIDASLKNGVMSYKSGDTGEVEAQFTVGNLSGTIEKQVIVRLKGELKTNAPIILNAKITITELVEITPRTLNWESGESPTPKTQKIRINYKEPVRITSVITTNNHFSPELKTLKDGLEYEITVTPKNTSETSFGIIKITTDSKLTQYRNLSAFALVRKTDKTSDKQ